MGAIQGIHCCYIKSFYGTLSGILNNFDREKNVIFSGLIREICYGVPTEWVEPLRGKTAFTGSTAKLKSVGSVAVFY